jgi:hypothetical protein
MEPGVPALPEYEEWRLEVTLPEGEVKTGDVLAALRECAPEGVDVHRKGRRRIRLYADSRASVDEAQARASELLAELRLRAPLDLRRWNPGEERWQSPFLPVDPPRQGLPDSWSALDEAAWEIRLRFEHDWERLQLETKLRDRDAAVISDRSKRLMIAVATEELARQRAAELRLAARTAEIEVRPLSRWRRWLLHQKLVGNYASRVRPAYWTLSGAGDHDGGGGDGGGDWGGDWGDGGGGDGGGD